MISRRLFATAFSLVGFMCVIHPSRADVYAWVDASGGVTYSDLAPPPGARVISVVSETAQPVSARANGRAPREPTQSEEVRVLSDRVRQLEREIELAAERAPPPAQYATIPPVMPYAPCSWADCGPWWSAPAYPIAYGAVVVGSRGFHHSHRSHGSRNFRHR
jgi:hypothetical protein